MSQYSEPQQPQQEPLNEVPGAAKPSEPALSPPKRSANADAVERRIASYRPRPVPAHWPAVADQLRGLVRRARPESSDQAGRWLTALTSVTKYGHADGQSPEQWLSEEQLRRFRCDPEYNLDHRARATYCATARYIQTTVFGSGGDVSTLENHGSDARPYRTEDVAELWHWGARHLEGRLRCAWLTLITLARGCGLSSHDIIHLGVVDVHVDVTPPVVIPHGDISRQILVRNQWKHFLHNAVAEIHTYHAGYIFRPECTARGRNTVSNLLQQTQRHGAPPLSVSRLRNTWIVNELASGVGLRDVMRQAGLSTFRSINALIPYLPWEGGAEDGPGDDAA